MRRPRAAADPFIAQLLGLLGPLARIVLFRLTVDMYREQPNVLPRAEVFIRSMQVHAPAVACRIAQSWELSDLATTALREQVDRVPPGQMGRWAARSTSASWPAW